MFTSFAFLRDPLCGRGGSGLFWVFDDGLREPGMSDGGGGGGISWVFDGGSRELGRLDGGGGGGISWVFDVGPPLLVELDGSPRRSATLISLASPLNRSRAARSLAAIAAGLSTSGLRDDISESIAASAGKRSRLIRSPRSSRARSLAAIRLQWMSRTGLMDASNDARCSSIPAAIRMICCSVLFKLLSLDCRSNVSSRSVVRALLGGFESTDSPLNMKLTPAAPALWIRTAARRSVRAARSGKGVIRGGGSSSELSRSCKDAAWDWNPCNGLGDPGVFEPTAEGSLLEKPKEVGE